MAFKMRSGNKTVFKQMGSTPAKNLGIYKGSGENRVRIGSEEAAELEAAGEKITRTAADNLDEEEGTQQIENLGETYAEIDAEMQKRAEGKEGLDPSQVNYRKQDSDDLLIRWMSDGPVTAKKAEKTLRKHENLKGGNPMEVKSEGSTIYRIDGKEVSKEKWEKVKANNEAIKEANKKNPRPEIIGDPYSKENQAKLKAYYKSLNK
mgnify:CR=1 FL=1